MMSGFGGNPEKENGRNRIGFKFTEWKIVIVEWKRWGESSGMNAIEMENV